MEMLGAERISGPLTDIEPTLRRQQATLEACYERQYKKDARTQGIFELELIIEADGRVKDLEPVKDSVKLEGLSGCIMTTVRRLHFPRSNIKRDTVVRVVINFVPAPPPPPPPAPPPPGPTPAPVATSPTGSASAPALRR
jgi:hypothetical protein